MEAGSFGNGVVCVVGIFEPGAVVELLERVEGSTRTDGGAVYGRRAADEHREVGFDDLEVGAKFFAVGYTAGRRLEIPVVAVDPAVTVTLVQPAIQPNPTAVGLDETKVVVQPPAPPAEPVESGLPEGVVSPLLTEPEPNEFVTIATPEPTTVTSPEPTSSPGAAPEPPATTEPLVEVPAPTEAPTPQTEPVVEPPPNVPASAVSLNPEPVLTAEQEAANQAVHAQLVTQAEGLLVAGPASRSVDELRAAITELGQTPIA